MRMEMDQVRDAMNRSSKRFSPSPGGWYMPAEEAG